MPASRAGSASCRAARHLPAALGVEAEAAEGVRDVPVDLLLVAAQPVVVGAGGRERGVERREVERRVEVERRLEQVERRGAGEHHRVHVGAVVEHVLLDGERAHAVAQQHQRDPGVLASGPAAGAGRCRGPARSSRPPRSRPARRPGRRSRRARGGPARRRRTLRGECRREVGVPQRVLAHPVGDLQRRPRLAVGHQRYAATVRPRALSRWRRSGRGIGSPSRGLPTPWPVPPR